MSKIHSTLPIGDKTLPEGAGVMRSSLAIHTVSYMPGGSAVVFSATLSLGVTSAQDYRGLISFDGSCILGTKTIVPGPLQGPL